MTGLVNPFAETTTFVYDIVGYEQRRVLANGITVSHTYDAAGRETVLSYRKPTGEAVAVYSSVYDALGNRLSQVELDGSIASYTHDAAYRMTAERRSGASPYHLTYTYDAVGNRLTMVDQDGARTTYSYNAGNELTQAEASETTEYAYDANGNLCLETVAGVSTTYTWDGENRLLGVTGADAGRWTYAYAADGLRREAATGAESRRYLWDGFDLLSEADAALSPTARYTTSPGVVLAQNRGGTPSFYAFDGPSNTRPLLDTAGAVSDSYVYQAFGVEEAVSGSTVNALRFGGQVGYQRDLGERVYVRARYYAPGVGRWVSRDPLGIELAGVHGSPHAYSYVGNAAPSLTDPTGPWPCAEIQKKIIDLVTLTRRALNNQNASPTDLRTQPVRREQDLRDLVHGAEDFARLMVSVLTAIGQQYSTRAWTQWVNRDRTPMFIDEQELSATPAFARNIAIEAIRHKLVNRVIYPMRDGRARCCPRVGLIMSDRCPTILTSHEDKWRDLQNTLGNFCLRVSGKCEVTESWGDVCGYFYMTCQ